jgi:lipoprotein-releasing system ATP-binding protein
VAEPVLRLQGVQRQFRQGGGHLDVLRGIDLELQPGRLVALVGPSGSGKSTLLHIAGLLERPSEGEVVIEGKACRRLSDREQTRLRRERIGFVYQAHHLLPDFSAEENVMMPLLLAGRPRAEARRRAQELLAATGLADRASHRPGRLSGGEQQRVAIARALANRPALVLADEPTGNLDPHTAEGVFDLLLGTVRSTGAAALVATHNPDLASRMDAIWTLREGRLDRLQAPAAPAPIPATAT